MNYTWNSYGSSLPHFSGCRFSVFLIWVPSHVVIRLGVFFPNFWSLAELTGCCNWNSITVYIQLIICVYIIVYYPIHNPLIDVVFFCFFKTMPNIYIYMITLSRFNIGHPDHSYTQLEFLRKHLSRHRRTSSSRCGNAMGGVHPSLEPWNHDR